MGMPLKNTIANDREWLNQQYTNKQISITDLAKEAGISVSQLRVRLLKFNIPIRPRGFIRDRAALCKKLKGRTSWNKNETKETDPRLNYFRPTAYKLGHVVPPDVLVKRMASQSGPNHPRWKGGITPLNQRERGSKAYADWRTSVYRRDHFTCQICGQVGGNLNANHIKPFADYPELRLEPTNGITLCKTCHLETVTRHEQDWESYFNFNLATRGILSDDFISQALSGGDR